MNSWVQFSCVLSILFSEACIIFVLTPPTDRIRLSPCCIFCYNFCGSHKLLMDGCCPSCNGNIPPPTLEMGNSDKLNTAQVKKHRQEWENGDGMGAMLLCRKQCTHNHHQGKKNPLKKNSEKHITCHVTCIT